MVERFSLNREYVKQESDFSNRTRRRKIAEWHGLSAKFIQAYEHRYHKQTKCPKKTENSYL